MQIPSTQIEHDVTAAQMAEFIESGRVTVAHLIECRTVEEDNADPYVQRLKKLVRDKAAGKVLQRYVNDELAAVAKEFKANKKAVEDDLGDSTGRLAR